MKPLLVGDRADVLVLDDQIETLQMLVGLLGVNYTVHPFTQGPDLLDYVQSGQPVDLVMLDVVMPAPDGFEVCRQLHALPEMEEVPIIFMSGLDSPLDEAAGLDLGAADYVAKPITPAIVLNRVGHHVRLGRAMRMMTLPSKNVLHS